MAIANAAGLLAMLALWWGVGSTHALWFVLGVVFAVGNLAYAELTSRFDPTLAGRVNAALNLATFVGAFSIQWGYGVMLDGLRAAGWTMTWTATGRPSSRCWRCRPRASAGSSGTGGTRPVPRPAWRAGAGRRLTRRRRR